MEKDEFQKRYDKAVTLVGTILTIQLIAGHEVSLPDLSKLKEMLWDTIDFTKEESE